MLLYPPKLTAQNFIKSSSGSADTFSGAKDKFVLSKAKLPPSARRRNNLVEDLLIKRDHSLVRGASGWEART